MCETVEAHPLRSSYCAVCSKQIPSLTASVRACRLLASVHHVLGGAFKLCSLTARVAYPGHGAQQLHPDWSEEPTVRLEPPEYRVCNSLWLLDEFTPTNGATRVLPGSHRRGLTGDSLADASAPHPQQAIVLGQQGSVTVFNAHLLHGGTTNRSDKPRWCLNAYFVEHKLSQQIPQAEYMRQWNFDRLISDGNIGRAILALLDVKEPKDEPGARCSNHPRI